MLVIETSKDWQERNIEVMVIVLKLMLFYSTKEQELFLSKWDAFFLELLPGCTKNWGVDPNTGKDQIKTQGISEAKKFLVTNGFAIERKPKGKQYKLYSLVPAQKEKIQGIVDKNSMPYDEELWDWFNDFYNKNDSTTDMDDLYKERLGF